jgi:signal transduction histidine kinase
MEADTTYTSIKADLYDLIITSNIMLGNKDKAIKYFELHRDWNNNIFQQSFQTSLSEMEVKYETEKKEIRISALEEEKRLMTWLSNAGASILLLTLIAFFFLWRWIVQKRRKAELQVRQLEQEKRLITTQATLDGEMQERTRLAQDLHDGLGSILAAAKYNLNDLKKIFGMNSVETEQFNTAIGLLDNSMREMRRIAHHLMPESLNSAGLKQSIADFCSSIPHLKFTYYGDENRFDSKQEIMIYRIIHELVNNALKHANASHIFVQIIRDADFIFLTVQDDGCGFDIGQQTSGMGLKNIHNRLAAYNGNVDIHSVVGEGTEVNIKLRVDN